MIKHGNTKPCKTCGHGKSFHGQSKHHACFIGDCHCVQYVPITQKRETRMIEIDGTAIPLEPGKTYLLVIKDGLVPRSAEYEIVKNLQNLGIHGMVLRVRGDVNQVRVVQVDQVETAVPA